MSNWCKRLRFYGHNKTMKWFDYSMHVIEGLLQAFSILHSSYSHEKLELNWTVSPLCCNRPDQAIKCLFLRILIDIYLIISVFITISVSIWLKTAYRFLRDSSRPFGTVNAIDPFRTLWTYATWTPNNNKCYMYVRKHIQRWAVVGTTFCCFCHWCNK